MAQQQQRADLTGVALIAGGVVLVAATLGGYAVGTLLDRRFSTGSVWATTGLIVGMLVGFIDLYRIATMILKRQPPITPALPKEPESDFPDEDIHHSDE